jgi:EAL domain-containing protein (putative c-di-GMP-specific phosphodiesterase class I)
MERMRLLGCRFSLDDFGSALSSFGYLRSFPVDYLKIDGVFMRGITDNAVNQALVRAINEVGHVMNIKTVAEYVEDSATAIGNAHAEAILRRCQAGVDPV